jgi:hypothetical protein
MTNVPDPKPRNRLASWAGYAAGVCALVGVIAKYLLGWFGPAPYAFFIAAAVLFIAYCLIDGAKPLGHEKPRAENDT